MQICSDICQCVRVAYIYVRLHCETASIPSEYTNEMTTCHILVRMQSRHQKICNTVHFRTYIIIIDTWFRLRKTLIRTAHVYM